MEELVQQDSRVDRYPKLVKGESKVVWEWQGARPTLPCSIVNLNAAPLLPHILPIRVLTIFVLNSKLTISEVRDFLELTLSYKSE